MQASATQPVGSSETRHATETCWVLHAAVPGRVRIKVQQLVRRPSLGVRLERDLRDVEGVRRATVHWRTGTMLVLFAPGLSLEAVQREVESLCAHYPSAPEPPWLRRLHSAENHRAELRPDDSTWHAESWEEIVHKLESSEDGLTAQARTARLHALGSNQLHKTAHRGALELLVGQLDSAPTLLLLGAAGLSFATRGASDGVAILATVLLNSAIGYATESSAERTLNALEQPPAESVRVVRSGHEVEVAAESLVPGDLLLLSIGDTIAADARLMRCDHLVVDESALTGEGVPTSKHSERLTEPRIPLGDRANMVFRGTTVTGGTARAIVVATGEATQIGRIQRLASNVRDRRTPLQVQLADLGRLLVVGSLSVCGAVCLVGAMRGFRLPRLFGMGVSLAVAAVPEGLPTVATTTLALGIRRMRKRNVIVRRLGAVETLGAVQVVCLDKTGTITENRMRVVQIRSVEGHYDVDERGFRRDVRRVQAGEERALSCMLEVMVLCSNVDLGDHEGTEPDCELLGSPTEAALMQLAVDAGVQPQSLRCANPLLGTGHRSQDRQIMHTVHEREGQPGWIAVKGRPTEVLARCSHFLDGENVHVLMDEHREAITKANDEMAGEALRVLGFAFRDGRDSQPVDPQTDVEELVWLGLAGMVDPPRAGVENLIERFHQAGIDTTMITGDQSATAESIARRIGLSRGGDLGVLDSTKLDTLEPAAMRAQAQQAHVFARVDPAHKLGIVRAQQHAGRVVCMTGDGINDGPALKAADVGVAMGKSGTEAAREVADVVLSDDELQSMLIAIEQGRTTYDDIKKAVQFILATNMTEISVTFAAVVAGVQEPLSPMQLLWINMLTDIFPELALAVEPPEHNVLERPPRDPNAAMFERSDLLRVGVSGGIISSFALAAYAYGILRYGQGPRARTVAFTSLTSAQLLHAISARSDTHSIFGPNRLARNPYLPLSVVGGLTMQVLAVLSPALRRLLGTTRMGFGDWTVACLAALGPLLLNELRKETRHSVPRKARSGTVRTAFPAPAG